MHHNTSNDVWSNPLIYTTGGGMLFQSLLLKPLWKFWTIRCVRYVHWMFVLRLIIDQKTLSALKISMSKKSWCKSGRPGLERHFSYLSQRPRYLLTSNLFIEIVNEHSKMQFLKSGGIRRRKSGFTTQCGSLMIFCLVRFYVKSILLVNWFSKFF